MLTFFSCRRYALLLLLALPLAAQAQNVGIGTAIPHASAALEISSTTTPKKGLLIPRMSQAERDAIAAPATGLLIFQTDATPGFYFYAGATAVPAWQPVSPAGDNLGNHTATQALNLQANALTGTGASISGVGVGVRADGGLNLGQNGLGNNVFLG